MNKASFASAARYAASPCALKLTRREEWPLRFSGKHETGNWHRSKLRHFFAGNRVENGFSYSVNENTIGTNVQSSTGSPLFLLGKIATFEQHRELLRQGEHNRWIG